MARSHRNATSTRSSALRRCCAVLALLALLGAPLRAEAAFMTAPGVNAFYDQALDITWYGTVTFVAWGTATANAASFVLNVGGTLYDQWRLPTVNVDGVGDPQLFSGALCANDQAGCVDNELGYLVHFQDTSVFTGFTPNWFLLSSDTITTVQGPSIWVQNTTGLLLLGTTTQASSGYAFFVHDGNLLPEPAPALLWGAALIALAPAARRR